MTVDTHVKDPEQITDAKEIDDILARMQAYENERGGQAVVLLIQNHQVGPIYKIRSKQEAQKRIQTPSCEPGIDYLTRSDIEQLKKKLQFYSQN